MQKPDFSLSIYADVRKGVAEAYGEHLWSKRNKLIFFRHVVCTLLFGPFHLGNGIFCVTYYTRVQLFVGVFIVEFLAQGAEIFRSSGVMKCGLLTASVERRRYS